MSDNLYVNRLEVSNFMRVEAATVDAHGNTVVIRCPECLSFMRKDGE